MMRNTSRETIPLWLIAALLAALLGLTLGGMWFYHTQEGVVREQAVNQFASIAQLKAEQIRAWRAERLADGVDLVESPFFAEGAARFLAGQDAAAGANMLLSFRNLAEHNHYADILLVDSQGQPRLSASGHSEAPGGYAPALLAALRDRKPVFTELHTEPQHPVPHLSVVVPILAGEQATTGSLGAIVLVSDASKWLYPMISSWPTPSKTAETLLVRRDGDEVLFLNNVRFQPDAALKMRIPLSRTEVPAVMAVLGRRGLFEGRDYRGIQAVAYIQAISDSPWLMIAKADSTEIFTEWHHRAALILIIFTGLGGLVIGCGLFAWQLNKKRHYHALYHAEAMLRTTMERHSIMLHAVGDGVVATDAQGRVELLSPVAEELTGWTQAEALGRPLEEVFRIVNEETRATVENPVTKVLREGTVVGLANHTLLLARNGREIPIADSAAPIRIDDDTINGVVMVFRDQTEERRAYRLLQARLSLMEYANTHTSGEMLTKALDEAGALVESPIGFFHFMNPEQDALMLQCWSTRTLAEFCQARADLAHYPLAQAGVWADCARDGRPIVHNDFASVPNRKGFPDGHAAVMRELTVPIIRHGNVVAIMGLGNKSVDYTDQDVQTVSYLADVVWHIIEHKHAEEALASSERKWRQILIHTPQIGISLNTKGKITFANEYFLDLTGWREDEVLGRDWFDTFLPEASRAEVRAVFNELVERQEIGNFSQHENEIITRHGDLRTIAWFNSFSTDSQDQVQEMTSLGIDLTERKHAEEALRESEQRFRLLFENAPFSYQSLDADGCIIDVNPAWLEALGYQREEVIGRSFGDFITPEDAALFAIRFPQFKAAGEVHDVQFEMIRKDKAHIKASFEGRIGRDEFGNFRQTHCIFTDITERERAEAERERLMAAIEQAGEAVVITDADGTIQYVNQAFERISGYTRAEAIGQNPRVLKSGRQDKSFYDEMWDTISHGGTWKGHLINKRKDGTLYTEEATISPMRDSSDAIVNYVAVKRDITEQLRLEAQFLQAQKMDSVGRLAGGVAHDFNNMLGVIIGHAELSLMKAGLDPAVQLDLQEIRQAAERSAALTRQLLAFARKQTIIPKVLDLNELVEGMLKMLRRIIGEDINLQWLPGAHAWPIKMDPAQIDQILVNLCINARDAIKGVGRISIETDRVTIDEKYCADHHEMTPGDFMLLTVSDSGCGMDQDTRTKIFEPFFTTKEVGQGTGLGLATVYGIVKQNKGFINVYSELGKGTTFRIYLPRHADEYRATDVQIKREIPAGRGELVLVVEDEPAILNLGQTMLQRLGYRVLVASTPSEALRLAEQHPGEIALLISDVIMPGMNGRDLSTQLHAHCPALKVLFMSGYTADVIAHHGILDPGVNFMQKPFSLEELANRVSETLNQE